MSCSLSFVPRWMLCAALLCGCTQAFAHGGVFVEEDSCVIEIGFYRAHFTIYQPTTKANEEFCEDVPDVTDTIFVLDYLHDSLKEVPVDFRIIKDVNDRTLYASWQDVERIGDLDPVTVFYQPPIIHTDTTFTAKHAFDEKGWYIGIVTTRHPTLDKTYQAVFGFHVGGNYGYWPLFIVLIGVVQLNYWLMSGGFKRWRERFKKKLTERSSCAPIGG